MRYCIIVFGCQFNQSDGERIAKLLEKKGYTQSPTLEGADLVVIIACSVRQSAVNRVYSLILNLKSKILNQQIIITGCVLDNDRKMFEKMGCEIKNFKGLEKIKPVSGLVPIGFGCNNFCTYCVVPYTRGREKYRNPKEIICEVKHLIKQGVKEITLIAQNVNSYQSGKVDFADLLQELNGLPGDFKLRFLTNHPKDMSDKLIKTIAECRKVKKQIHLPFQAGDNTILKKMNRKYKRQDYLALVAKIRKAMPNVELTTDVIVGFPGETKKQFQKTVEVFKKAGFKQAFIGKYSPRPGTAAFKMKDNVPWEEKKHREQILLELIRNKKLIVILGPTASGKTGLSVKLAKKFNGEVVSADSRQVYKGMDLGTGKVTKKEAQGVPHYLLSIVSAKTTFSAAQYKEKAERAIDNVLAKSKVPFLVGGSPFYLYSVVDGLKFPKMKAIKALRKKMEKKSIEQLLKILEKIAPERAKNIETKNKRRIIRAIEIAKSLGSVPKLEKNPKYDCLILGVQKSKKELKALIRARLLRRMKAGMAKEVENLHKAGVSWKRLDDFGLEYRWLARYLEGKIAKQEMLAYLETDINRLAKRQMTWFKRDKRIIWLKKENEAIGLIKKFLNYNI